MVKINEEEVNKRLDEFGYTDGIKVGIYWYINDEGRVVFDIEEMRREFENKITNIKGLFE